MVASESSMVEPSVMILEAIVGGRFLEPRAENEED